MMQDLLKSLNDLKCQYEFWRFDCEAHLLKLHDEAHEMMARRICTIYVTNIGDDLTTKETAKAKPLVVNNCKAFKIE